MEPGASGRKGEPPAGPDATRIRAGRGVFVVAAETFQTVAKVGEIPEGQGRSYEVDGQMVAVFLEGGQYYAIEDSCPHQGAPLSDGIVFDQSVTCTWHGWRFSLADGRHLDGSRCRVAAFPVRVVGDEIQVSMGED
jgi:nitrite reductase (NADH) small subunit